MKGPLYKSIYMDRTMVYIYRVYLIQGPLISLDLFFYQVTLGMWVGVCIMDIDLNII